MAQEGGWMLDPVARPKRVGPKTVGPSRLGMMRILETAPLGAVVFCRDGAIQFANAKAAALFGMQPAAMHELPMRLLHDSPETWRRLRASIDAQSEVNGAKVTLRRVGEPSFLAQVDWRETRFNDKDCILCWVQDIGSHHDQQERLERQFDAAPLPMLMVRAKGTHIVNANRRAVELFIPGRAVESCKLEDIIGPQGCRAFLQQLRGGGFVDAFEIVMTTAYGETFPGSLSGQILEICGERFILIGITDITEAKISQSLLEEAKEAAERATLAKSMFLASMSHEIRTPMNGVLGMIDVLGGTALDVEQGEMVDVARQSAMALLSIIDDILDLSKIEAGKLSLEAIPFPLDEVIESAIDLVSGRAAVKGLELAWEVSPSLPDLLVGDPVRLRQIFINLMGNAVKFTDKGHVTLRCQLLAWDGVHPLIRFEVSDTGIGLTDEQQQRLFQPFAQADSSTTRQFGGTGLGLSISRRLVELMGGEIGVTSSFGQGATFWMEIPFSAAAEIPVAAPPVSLAGRTMLVVDDLAVARAGISQMLRRWGAMVLPLASIAEAEAILGKQGAPVDVLLLDEQPGSLEMARQARKLYPGLRVLLLAQGEGNAVPATLVQDEFTVLTKPVRSRTLARAVAAAVDQEIALSVRRPEAPEQQSAPLERPEALTQGRLILVAEDNPTNRLVIAKQLQRLGHSFDMVEDGLEAVQALAHTAYGLLLTDCFMPNLDGYQLAQAIRDNEAKSPQGRRLPIVALTANALEGEDGKCREAGMDAYLSKPVILDKLRAALDSWLPPRIQAAPAPAPAPEAAKPAPVNLAMLKEILGTDEPDVVMEVLGFFVETFVELRTRLSDAIGSRDRQQVRNAAHAAKGAAGNAGADCLAAVLAQIEQSAAKGNWARLGRLAGEVDTHFNQIEAWLAQTPPPAASEQA